MKTNKYLQFNNSLQQCNYSIADISLFPWIARHEWHMPDRIDLRNNYNFLVNWSERVGSRPAVIKGYDCLDTGEQIPKI